jgi:TPR repeat protein
MVTIAAMRARFIALVLVVVACKGGSHSKLMDDAQGSGSGSAIDPAELAAQFDKKCVAGDLEACRNLGVMYAEGTGVSPDPRRAVALFGQACTGGNLSACNHLGLALAEGMGVDKNPQRAMDVYQKACDGGYRLSCRNLGLMLRDGRGVPQDLDRADKLLDKACKGNVPFACTNAGDLDAALAQKGGNARWKQAIAHYKLGCDAGDPTACRAIGIAYLEGKGLPRSAAAAAVWLERACQPDDPVACRLLGVMATQGAGVPKDVERGKQLLTRACDAKDDEACRLLKLANDPAAADAGVANALPDAAAEGSDRGSSAPH